MKCFRCLIALSAWLAGIYFLVSCQPDVSTDSAVYSNTTKFEPSLELIRAVPNLAEQIYSTNLSERISVLDKIVVTRSDDDVVWQELPFNLPKSDYVGVANAIFSAGLFDAREELLCKVLSKLTYAATQRGIDELGPAFVAFLSHSNSTVQYQALEAIGKLKPAGCNRQVAALLSYPEWPVGRKALETLLELRAREAIPPLAVQLESTNDTTRYIAIKQLEKLGDLKAAPHLARRLSDASADNRYWALEALGKLKAIDELHRALRNSTSPNIEARILSWLVAAGDKESCPVVARYILTGGRIDSHLMRKNLTEVRADAICPELANQLRSRLLLGGKTVDDDLLLEVALFMAEFQKSEAIPFLREFLKRHPPHPNSRGLNGIESYNRDNVVSALGKLRAQEAVPDLLPLLNEDVSGDTESVHAAEIALSQIADPTSCQVLLQRIHDPAHPLRGQILANLNVAIDEPLLVKINKTRFKGLYIAPVNSVTAAIIKDTKIPVVLHYEPASGQAWPITNTYVEMVTVRFGLEQVVGALGNSYTILLRDGKVHILPIRDALEFWDNLMKTHG